MRDSFSKDKTISIVTLKNADCQCQIFPFGAHISSLIVDGEERLWLSSLSPTDGSAPIRGGIPISFPHYYDEGDLKVHCFVRESLWEIHKYTETRAVLRLQDSDETYKIWPKHFLLEYTIDLMDRGISLHLKISNVGGLDSTFCFTGGFPAYLRFEDTERVILLGFKKTRYIDKVDGCKEKIQKGPINIHTEALRTTKDARVEEGYVNRVYLDSPIELEFHDLVTRQQLVKVTQSRSWPDTVLYNPWLGDKQGDQDPDFDDDGFLYMICWQPAITKADAVTVCPGDGGWFGSITITFPP